MNTAAAPADPRQSLSRLIYQLGGASVVLPVPAPAPGLTDPVEIGALGGLPVWTGSGTWRETAGCARRLARRGALALLIGHDSERWHLAATVAPVRVTTIAANQFDALPLRRLMRALAIPRMSTLEWAYAIADALDVDAAGRRTFALLHSLLARGVDAMPASVRRERRHAWLLTQLTRLLFLRFVEAEGWLNGNPRFLAELFDACLRNDRDPLRSMLHPLFFGTLNRQFKQRSRLARSFGAVPFLNGGLFEMHQVERGSRLDLPTELWRDVFEAMVDRIEVSLDHDTLDGRVTPELLGRVFEGVMDPDQRRGSGTFFTPPALVDALLRDAFAIHLAQRLDTSEAVAARRLDDPDAATLRALLDTAVLDPAAGSGAFLVGALHLLHGPQPADARRIRFLVTRRLFGVDLHPAAVRLAELRLWLEVLRAMRGRSASEIQPLPNLDNAIRAGDALLDPLHGQALARAATICELQRAGAQLHGRAKRVAIAATRAAERRAVLATLRNCADQTETAIAEWLHAVRSPTLFDSRCKVSRGEQMQLRAMRQRLRMLRRSIREIERDASATPFAIAAAFAPIFARRGGFDLVVGNPPWVRAERLDPDLRMALHQRYGWWRSSGTGWRHQPDIAIAFLQRATELLRDGGTLALLMPAKIATASYAATARAELARRSTLHCVADLSRDERAGFDATIYPLAILASRAVPTAVHEVRTGLGRSGETVPQRRWADAPTWSLATSAVQRVAARLRQEHPTLGESVRPQLGVKTGANAAFLDPPERLREWSRPAVRGRDVRAFAICAHDWMLWPADSRGHPWTRLPDPVADYLRESESQLRRRADQLRGPWWQLFRTGPATAPHRVVWRDLSNRLEAAWIDRDDLVPLNSCYVAAMPSAHAAAALAAWLNATAIRTLVRAIAEPAAGGYARFAARAVSDAPLPLGVLQDAALAAFTHAAGDHDVQHALDERVESMLGLTAAEADLLRDVAPYSR